MNQSLKEIQLLLIRLSIALLAFPISKLIFFLFNHAYFSDVSVSDFLSILFFGLRFDISALALINAPFIIFHIIPFNFTKTKWYQTVLKVVFLACNSIAILADCVDLEYYKFTHKRTTADFFDLLGLGSDVSRMLPHYIRDFWYIILIWIAIIVFIGWLYNKASGPSLIGLSGRQVSPKGRRLNVQHSYSLGRLGWAWFFWPILNSALIGLLIIGFRGGLQLRPIMPINAAEYVSAKNIPLIINTSFSIIKSYGLEKLEEKNYFSDAELKKIFDPIHIANKKSDIFTGQSSGKTDSQPNIFIILLESFSKEYIGSLSGKKTYTPFLDSLIKESLVFKNAFANGKKSIDGIPAIIAGIPSLMNESYITSTYSSNRFIAIPHLLKDKGYTSAFFHGGTNGTMGFDAFCNAAGFDKYYGRTEYNNEKDFDGDWGIWDEEFFQYTEKTVSQMQQPFLVGLFTLSSHHPFFIPDKYKQRFQGGDIPILKSVEYADFSLRIFFKSASKEKWFDNTLFIITADHTGPSIDENKSNTSDLFKIPILLYKHNSSFRGVNDKLTQHIDIMPTILHYLNSDVDFYSFGNSMLDSTKSGYAVNYINDVYQIFEDDYLLMFEGSKEIALYNYKTDTLLQNNLIGTEPEREKQMEDKLKAIIQTNYHDLIHNQMTIKSKDTKNRQ